MCLRLGRWSHLACVACPAPHLILAQNQRKGFTTVVERLLHDLLVISAHPDFQVRSTGSLRVRRGMTMQPW